MSKSVVKEIAVYRNGCFIKRSGTIDLKQGKHTVIIDYLPQSLDSSTLALYLPENTSGSNVQVELLDEEERIKITEEINKKIRNVDNNIQIRQSQIEMWNKNADFSAKDTLSIEQMADYIEKLPDRLNKIYEEIDKLEKERYELEKQLEDKNKEANCYVVKADIDAKEDSECQYAVRYFDPNANWYPIYEIHTSEDNDLSILLKAKVTHYINEDFKDVKISLFSSNPTVSANIPVLHPSRINFYSPRQADKMMFAGASANTMIYGDAQAIEEVSFSKVSSPGASVKQEDSMMEYELDGLWTIESEKPLSVDLSENRIPCRYHVIAIPKMDDCAYLAAEVNTSDISDLIECSAKIYHKGTYIGEIYLSPDLDEDKYDISLGRDETIKLKRNQKKKYTSNVLLKNQKKTEYEYELKITSTKNKPFPVTLIDQIPVSQDKSIVVDATNLSKGKLDEDTGKITWDFDIEPSENKVIDLAYSVSWPKDRMINI